MDGLLVCMVVVSASFFLFCGISESDTGPSQLSSLQFTHGGEVYSPTESLSETSIIVAEEKEHLLDENDMQALDTDLRRLARFIRIAYNGIGAAGPRYVDLQIQVQHLGYDITHLCDKSVRILKRFTKTSKAVVMKRQTAYQFVVDGFEEIAVDILSSLAEDARKMERAALELHDDFQSTEQKVIATLDNALSTQTNQEVRFKDLERQRIRMEVTKTVEERRVEDEERLEKKARRLTLQYEMLENQAIRELTTNSRHIKNFVNYASKILGGGDVFTDDSESITELFHKFRLDELQREDMHREARLKALDKLKEAAMKVADIDSVFESEENIAGAVVDALHLSIGALRNLSEVMMRAAGIWGDLEDYCDDLAELRKPTDGASEEYSDDKRLAIWTSEPTKKIYVCGSAKWVALYMVCKEFVEKMKLTKDELHRYIRENPTYEESRKTIKELATDFLTDVEQEKNGILVSMERANDKRSKYEVEFKHSHQEL